MCEVIHLIEQVLEVQLAVVGYKIGQTTTVCTTTMLLVGSELRLLQKLQDISCRDRIYQFGLMDTKVLLLGALVPEAQTPTALRLQPNRLTTSAD